MPIRKKQFIVLMLIDRDGFGFNEHTLPPLVALMDAASPDCRQWDHSSVSGYFLASSSATARVQKVMKAAKHLRDMDERFASLGMGYAEGLMIAEMTWLGRLKRGKIPLGHAASDAFRKAARPPREPQWITLKHDDIIGHAITVVHAIERRSGDLDVTFTFYTLDNGFIVILPLACSPFLGVDPIPAAAQLLQGPVIERCLSSPIAKVLAIQDANGFIDPDSLVVELESGDCLTDHAVAPHGTGMSGLRCYRPGELGLSRHSDYWALDRAADERRMKEFMSGSRSH